MIGTILGILGIVFTLGFGGYSIWVYKKSKRNVSLEFRNTECYSLFRDDVNRLNIELIYNKTTVNNTLILLKAKLINNGQIDIDKNRIYNPLKIKTTEIYKWLEATVTSSPTGASTNIELISDQEIQLNWDLLKHNEYIEIEALVEIIGELEKEGEKGTEFYNNLNFDYRITDLNSIQKEKQISNSIRRKALSNKMSKIMAIVSIIIGALFLSFEFFPAINIMEKQVVSYAIKKGNNELVSIISVNNKSDKIKLSIEGEEDEREITIDEFNRTYELQKIKKTTIDPKSSLFNRIIGAVYIGLGLLLLLLEQLFSLLKKRKKKAANTV
ncbi:hypothetical protein [Tenacibaculum sp. SDUM215027]|uniref:hypothetical protein n=1 Tax=Tenacibaculum sp. SDUM215027 TaxID=3422596 RepID=UPI003D3203C0